MRFELEVYNRTPEKSSATFYATVYITPSGAEEMLKHMKTVSEHNALYMTFWSYIPNVSSEDDEYLEMDTCKLYVYKDRVNWEGATKYRDMKIATESISTAQLKGVIDEG